MQPFDLPAYLERIALPYAPAADAAGLAAVHRAHRLAIPFENLDIPLGVGIHIDPASIFAKLVTGRRGGYCFEQNSLFLDALRALGFTTRPLLARVWLMAETTPPLTHTFNLVTIDGRAWIADAGFGGSFSPPMLLDDGAAHSAPDGTAHRLIRLDDRAWMLERAGDSGPTDGRSMPTRDWQRQYSFTLDSVESVDLELSNHWTSTRPGTRFTTLAIASRVTENGFVSLVDRQLSEHGGGESRHRTIASPGEYRAVLAQHMGLALSDAQVEHLFHGMQS
ncbi:acetyltransferase [Sphingobium algorifonticola]|uniref:Acetyltransferase n=1 Tax=Sphingobium algorifonticola TaxID=2008318 RepID=A0A437JDK4_9SPHN|nr:acetyltransferase [Sphingobium algorifonticola]